MRFVGVGEARRSDRAEAEKSGFWFSLHQPQTVLAASSLLASVRRSSIYLSGTP